MTGDLKYINKSLEKSFKILEILSKSIFPQKAATISRKASMSRTTTFRLLFVLTQLGYIHKNNSKLEIRNLHLFLRFQVPPYW